MVVRTATLFISRALASRQGPSALRSAAFSSSSSFAQEGASKASEDASNTAQSLSSRLRQARGVASGSSSPSTTTASADAPVPGHSGAQAFNALGGVTASAADLNLTSSNQRPQRGDGRDPRSGNNARATRAANSNVVHMQNIVRGTSAAGSDGRGPRGQDKRQGGQSHQAQGQREWQGHQRSDNKKPNRRSGPNRPKASRSAGQGSGPSRSGRPVPNEPAPLPTTDWRSPLSLLAGRPRTLAGSPINTGVVRSVQEPAPLLVDGKHTLRKAVQGLRLRVGQPREVAAVSHGASESGISLAKEVRETRLRKLDEEVGGDYSAYVPGAALPSSLRPRDPEQGKQQQEKLPSGAERWAVIATRDADQALALNADLSPSGRGYALEAVGRRLGLGNVWDVKDKAKGKAGEAQS